MRTNLEDITSVKKKLSVEIESEEVDRKFNKVYKELGKQVKIPGFRLGKVPRKILERHIGSQVTEDVVKDLINETLPGALEEVKTFPLGVPILEKETLKQGQDFKYSAIMEVRPQFEIENYLGLEVEKETCSVTEQDVQDQLAQIRNAHGTLTSIDSYRPIKKNDYVVLDYQGFEKGQPLEEIHASNFLLKVGGNDFHPKFEESLIGLKKDDEAEIKVEFESGYPHTKLAGKTVDFKIKIIDIKKMVLPELNDEFAQNLGADLKDLKDLNNKVRETILTQEEKRIDSELKRNLLKKVSDSVDFELPQTLVEAEIEQVVENVKQNLIRSGSNLEKTGLSEEKLRKDFRPASEKRVKNLLILGEIAKQEKLAVNEEDLNQGFKDLAASTGQDAETLRKYYQARNLMDALEEKLLEEKTLNYLVENAKISILDPQSKNNSKKKEND
ncbi:MAG: trigger factor [Pseudomonadota bacterium]